MAARSEAPHDPRPYIRVATDLPMNPKLAAIEENFHQCGWAYICSLCYCGQSLTDGHFPLRAVLRMADVTRDEVMALVEQGLWHLPDHDCPDCEQPKAGHAVIHDYLQHQRSAAEVHDLSAKRREAGKKGAKKRWAPPKQALSDAQEDPPLIASATPSAMANAMPSAQQGLWQTDSNVMAEEMRGDKTKEQTPTGSADPATPESALAAPGLSPTQRSAIITNAYRQIEPMSKWPAINGIVLHAIKAGKYTDAQILDAMRRMATEGRTASVEALRIEITGFVPRPNPGNAVARVNDTQERADGGLAYRGSPPTRRSASVARAEQALSIADELDRENGHGHYAQGAAQ